MTELMLTDFSKTPATHVISLGCRCATAYNIRRHFNFSGAFPFDWWISTAHGVLNLLDNFDIDLLYSPNHLQITEDSLSVGHNSLYILLHHEFPRLRDRPGHPVVPNFLDFIEQPKTRTAYLFNKLLQLNAEGRRMLFIREKRSNESEDPARFASSLRKLFPLAEWCLVTISIEIPEDDVHGWRCDPGKWDDILGNLGVRLDLSGHKPFDINTEPDINSAQER